MQFRTSQKKSRNAYAFRSHGSSNRTTGRRMATSVTFGFDSSIRSTEIEHIRLLPVGAKLQK